MALYYPGDRTIKLDIDNGTLTDIGAILREFVAPEIEAVLEDATGPTDASTLWRKSGFNQYSDVTMRLDADFGGAVDAWTEFGKANIGDTRTLEITYGGTTKLTVECVIAAARLVTDAKKATEMTVRLKLTGDPTFA